MDRHRTLATACLASLIVTLYQVASVISTLNSWEGWNQPQIAGKLLMAAVFGLVALALGLGLNVASLLRGFGVPVGPAAPVEKETV